MILVGDKNSSSKAISCNSSNLYVPIKFGRHNHTASNVIKILIGDSNNKAREIYFMPLYDWRAEFYSNATNASVDVVAKYKDDISDRDPSLTEASVDTFIYTPISGYYIIDVDFLDWENYKNFNNMAIYAPYISNLIFNHDPSTEVTYRGLCGHIDKSKIENEEVVINTPNYSSLEHVVLDSNITELYDSFTCTPNLKSVFVSNTNMIVDGPTNSFTSHVDGCIILWKVESLENSETRYDYTQLISTEYPTLLVYPCVEDAEYHSDGMISANYEDDVAMTVSDYTALYHSVDDINNILG